MWWFVILAVLIPLIIWFGYLKPFSYWKKMGVDQTKPWIFVGDSGPALLRITTLPEFLDRIYYLHPGSRFTGIYQFFIPILLLRDLELIKQLTVKDFDYFTDHNSISSLEDVEPLWSKNLVALKGQRWRDIRALLSGSFTSSKMKIMYTLISETSENFVKHFLNKNEDLIEVEMKDSFTRYTNDVIASTSFGIKVNSLEDPKNEFYLMGKEATSFAGFATTLKLIIMLLFPWLVRLFDLRIFPRRVTKFFTDLIDENIKVREEQGIVRPDMINILLEVKNGVQRSEEKEVIDTGFAVVDDSSGTVKPQKRQIEITSEDIASQAMIFFLAGFETVATAMCFISYELAVNPDVQDKLRKEIKETLEDCDGKLTYETLLKMKYLDMVVSESLRKWPIAAITDRVCVKPYTLKSTNSEEPTISFKKKTCIWVPILSIQHDPKYYPEPDKFIPERFSDENKGNIKPYTYMPFGIGPRACIGSRFALLEVKSVIVQMLNNFEIVPVKKTMVPLKPSKKLFTLMPDGGFPLGLRRLNK